MPAKTKSCAACGTVLPDRRLEGLCPRCLLARGLDLLACSPGLPDAGGHEDVSGPTTPFTGTRWRYFGDYELVEEIARGGMGVVFKARQKSLNRLVALKLISAGALATPDLVKRFKAEAAAAATLTHPNIVPIHEIGEHQGQHYFSMGLIEGPNLASWISNRRSRISNADAAHLIVLIARAVHHAHQRGVLHRDLKPGNILLDAEGQPHLTDFGLAKLVQQASTLTHTYAVLGTPAYMAPEQARGDAKAVTTAADVYGLGAVLYEVLTGSPPFAGGTSLGTIRQVLDREPRRPTLWNPAVDPDLETICLKCLEKDPERRYRSAEALADDLDRWLRHEPIAARPATQLERVQKWLRRRPAMAALLGITFLTVLLGVTGVTWQWRAARRLAREEARQREQAEANLYVAETANAFAAWERGSVTLPRQLLERQLPARRGFEWYYLDALCRRPQGLLFTFEGELSPIFGVACSPDGKMVAAAHQQGKTRLLDIVARRELEWVGRGGPYSMAFSPDGNRLASAGTTGVFVWDLEKHCAWTNAVPESPAVPIGTVWSADGRAIVTTSAAHLYEPTPPGPIVLWDASTLQKRFVLEGHAASAWKPDLSPDGRWLATPHGDGSIILWDLASRKPVRTFLRHGSFVSCVRFSPDGKWLASASMDETVRLWRVNSDEQFLLGSHVRPVDCVAFSRDGRWLASGSRDHTAKLWDMANLTNKPLTLRGHTGRLWSIDFTPDSRQLVTGSVDGTVKLWDVGRLGRQRSETDNMTPLGMVFSPDARFNARHKGAVVGLIDGRTEYSQIEIREVATERLIATLPATDAAFSPQGVIASVSGTNGFSVWDGPAFERRTDVASDACLNGTEPNAAVQFSPDGHWLALARDAQAYDGVTLPARGIELRETAQWRKHGVWHLGSARTNTFRFFRFSPDSRFLAASCSDEAVRVVEVPSLCPAPHPFRAGLRAKRIVWVPRTHTLCVGCLDASVHFWNVDTDEAEVFRPQAGNVWALDISPDGRTLAIGTQDGVLKLINLPTRREIATLKGHLTTFADLAFSPDGRLLISASETTRIWRAFVPDEEQAGPTAP